MTLSRDASLLWETALALNRAAAAVSPDAANLPPLLFLTDPVRTPEPWTTAARLPAGSGVIFRHFGAHDAEDQARRLREITRDAGVCLLIGRDAGLAETIGADGVHLPEVRLEDAKSLRAAHPGWIITAALHDGGQPCDVVSARVLSPVFPAGGPSADRPALGSERFSAIAATQPRPVYALGGITPAHTAQLAKTRACGIAAVGAVQRAFR